ncbi:hypothetical protein HT031_001846 [Scenedesmus sp. PABB004]|nr:hypothetical protein HT031_001846 [Scenedesmus sp. PABB004]
MHSLGGRVPATPAAGAHQQQQRRQRCAAAPPPPQLGLTRPVAALPSIREFIRDECPCPGAIDGRWRERPRAATVEASVVLRPPGAVVPGSRALWEVSGEQLDRIVADGGLLVVCSLLDDGRVAAPKRGAWSCLAAVAGLQRLGGERGLVRAQVLDRVAVQALDARGGAGAALAQAAVLRDRWAYFVRLDALAAHAAAAQPGHPGGGGGGGDAEVPRALAQVADAVAELDGALAALAARVQVLADDAPGGGALAQALASAEAADELAGVLAWARLAGPLDGPAGDGAADGAATDRPQLLERAWRLSWAPFAAGGVAAALGRDAGLAAARREALEATDLGARLEQASEHAAELAAALAAAAALA